MSFSRQLYWSSVLCGWSAFLAWAFTEMSSGAAGSGHSIGSVVATLAIVGGSIAFGLSLSTGSVSGSWRQAAKRCAAGAVCGLLGGAVGGLLGELLYSFAGVPRAIAWMVMGVSVGLADGAYEKSRSRIRNGVIGGAIGGLVGGLCFDPIIQLIDSPTGMSSRAVAFTVLGLSIGLCIGLVQVVLKKAWLTVVDGFRPGRQLIIDADRVVLGRAEYASLVFRGKNDSSVELEHAVIQRSPAGYVLHNNSSTGDTGLNGQPITGDVALAHGDIIKIGRNYLMFEAANPVHTPAGSQTDSTRGTSNSSSVSGKRAIPPPPKGADASSRSTPPGPQPGTTPAKRRLPPPPPPRRS
jgi:hypothetical protein